MSLNFDTLFGPYADKNTIIYSYDWVDIDSATGYVSYEAFRTAQDDGSTYHLEKSSERTNLWSRNGYTAASAQVGSIIKIIDVDFDTSVFQKTRTIRGNAFVKAAVMLDISAPQDLEHMYITVKIRKWNATTSTETEIVSDTSDDYTAIDTDNPHNIFIVGLTIPETNINVGEQIRLTIEVYVDTSIADTHVAYLYCNPQGTTTTEFNLSGDTRLVFACPFKIEAITT
jgi:hypothetical protein